MRTLHGKYQDKDMKKYWRESSKGFTERRNSN